MKIAILSASVRTGRNSHRVALLFKRYIETNNLASVEVLDLQHYQFPIFEERLKFQKNPSSIVLEFAKKIQTADGVIIITPEYNGGVSGKFKKCYRSIK